MSAAFSLKNYAFNKKAVSISEVHFYLDILHCLYQ